MDAVASLCLGALVRDFMVLGAATGGMPRALTPREMGKAASGSPLVHLWVLRGRELSVLGLWVILST